MFNRLKHKICVKMFYYWHSSYHKWMKSIARSDLETLKKELEAIEQVKREDVDNEFREYKLEMLEGQEAIVRRLIEEMERQRT